MNVENVFPSLDPNKIVNKTWSLYSKFRKAVSLQQNGKVSMRFAQWNVKNYLDD